MLALYQDRTGCIRRGSLSLCDMDVGACVFSRAMVLEL
jgi:hypothetical protein